MRLSYLRQWAFWASFIPLFSTHGICQASAPNVGLSPPQPLVVPRLQRSSITVTSQQGNVTVRATILLSRTFPEVDLGVPVHYGLGVADPHNLAGTKKNLTTVGEVAVANTTTVNVTISVPLSMNQTASILEIEALALASDGDVGSASSDMTYVLLERSGNGQLRVVRTVEPQDYWPTWLDDLVSRNQTIRSSRVIDGPGTGPGTSIPVDPTCATIPLLPGTPCLDIRVRYEEFWRGDSGARSFPLPFAKINVRVTVPSTSTSHIISLVLNERGRTLTQLPTGGVVSHVSLVFSDAMFDVKVGSSQATLRTWSLPLPFVVSSATHTYVDEIIVADIGPYLGHLWWSLQDMRQRADAMLGRLDPAVGGITLWYPMTKTDYTPGQALVRLEAQYVSGRPVVAHEYGHHVMHSLAGIPAGAGGDHTFCPPIAPNNALAYSEGYATAFSLYVLGEASFWHRYYNKASRNTPIDHYHCHHDSDMDMTVSEGRFAAGLFDIMDVEGHVPEESDHPLAYYWGQPGFSDWTRDTTRITPRMVLRDSITGPRLNNIDGWWERFSDANSGVVGFADAERSMQYNYLLD